MARSRKMAVPFMLNGSCQSPSKPLASAMAVRITLRNGSVSTALIRATSYRPVRGRRVLLRFNQHLLLIVDRMVPILRDQGKRSSHPTRQPDGLGGLVHHRVAKRARLHRQLYT